MQLRFAGRPKWSIPPRASQTIVLLSDVVELVITRALPMPPNDSAWILDVIRENVLATQIRVCSYHVARTSQGWPVLAFFTEAPDILGVLRHRLHAFVRLGPHSIVIRASSLSASAISEHKADILLAIERAELCCDNADIGPLALIWA